MTVRNTNEDAYFAASNSKSGFHSYYRECFERACVKHIYAIKGGPGTGKSYFLRAISDFGEARGWRSEKIYCSSDPDSLDGVLLFRKDDALAFLDATAPHVYEPRLPGLREDIVNLGDFWNIEKLTAHADELEALIQKKGEAYQRAYRYLASVGEMRAVRDALVLPYLNLDGMRRYAQKLMRSVPQGNGYSAEIALMRSVGMRGDVLFDTYLQQAERICLVEDCKGVATHFMRMIGEDCVQKGLRVRISHDPICPERIDAILLRDSGILFATYKVDECVYPHKLIRLRRFVRVSQMREIAPSVRYAERMAQAMLDGALECLREVGTLHFKIEERYIEAMDFDAKENFTKSFCEKILT